MKISENMYGIDKTDMAESIAADALTPAAGAAGTNESDYWGQTTDERATGKGNMPEYDEKAEVTILRKAAAGGGDKDALNDSTAGGNRHRPGPTTSKDTGVKYPGPAGKK